GLVHPGGRGFRVLQRVRYEGVQPFGAVFPTADLAQGQARQLGGPDLPRRDRFRGGVDRHVEPVHGARSPAAGPPSSPPAPASSAARRGTVKKPSTNDGASCASGMLSASAPAASSRSGADPSA